MNRFVAVAALVIVAGAAWVYQSAEDHGFSAPNSPLANTPSNTIVWQDRDVTSNASTTDSESEPEATFEIEESIWDEFAQKKLWAIVSRHWQKAQKDNADSMLAVYEALDSCEVYEPRFRGKDISEVRAEFSGYNEPELIELNESIWSHCGPLYANWDSYGADWKDMPMRAAELGQPVALARLARTQIRREETVDEGIGRLETALTPADPYAALVVGDIYRDAQASPEKVSSWLLAACRLGMDCSPDGTFMKATCGPFSTDCGISESVADYLLRTLGDDGFQQASDQASTLVSALEAGNFPRDEILDTISATN